MPKGKSPDEVKAELEAILTRELAGRSIAYQRSDGSPWKLTLADVLERAKALEMAYNPNDCVEVRWGASTPQKSELSIKAKSETRLHVMGAESTAANDWLVGRPLRPFGDLRGSFEPQVNGYVGGGLEIGGGVELSWFRLGAYFRVYPYFWVTPRFQFAVPVHPNFNVLLEVSVPFAIGGGFNVGLGGAGGAEWYPFKFFGVYAMFGGQHFFVRDATSFIVTGGARLRLP